MSRPVTFRPQLPGDRPEPPDRLREDMRVEWWRFVNRMPAGWFTLEMLPLLEELCRNICYGRAMVVELDKVDLTKIMSDLDLRKRYDWLLGRYQRTTGLTASLATRLRLTAQARIAPRQKVTEAGTSRVTGEKPWDTDGPEPRVN